MSREAAFRKILTLLIALMIYPSFVYSQPYEVELVRGKGAPLCEGLHAAIKKYLPKNKKKYETLKRCLPNIIENYPDFVSLEWSDPVPAKDHFNLILEWYKYMYMDIGGYLYFTGELASWEKPVDVEEKIASVSASAHSMAETVIKDGMQIQFTAVPVPVPERSLHYFEGKPDMLKPFTLMRMSYRDVARETECPEYPPAKEGSGKGIAVVNADLTGLDLRLSPHVIDDYPWFQIFRGIYDHDDYYYYKGVLHGIHWSSGGGIEIEPENNFADLVDRSCIINIYD